jgi:hypothetical protein
VNVDAAAAKRWKPVAKLTARRDKISVQLWEARARAAELSAQLPAAKERDRQARGRALADATEPPASEADRISRELEDAQRLAADLEAAGEVLAAELRDLREAHREQWAPEQAQVVANAREQLLRSCERLEEDAQALEDATALHAWAVRDEIATVDPFGGRLTNTGALREAIGQLRAAVQGLAAGETNRPVPPQPEPSWLQRRLAAKANTGWG